MWQHLKRALEEFAQIKLKSMFMPRGCRVLHLKIRRPSALRLSLVLWRPARTTATIISSVVWLGEEKCLATGRSAFLRQIWGVRRTCPQAYVRFRQRTTECMPDKLWYTRGYLSCMRTSAVWSEVHRGCWSGRLGWYGHRSCIVDDGREKFHLVHPQCLRRIEGCCWPRNHAGWCRGGTRRVLASYQTVSLRVSF